MRQEAIRLVRRIRRLRSRMQAAFRPHGLILMYHRVAIPKSDPWGLAVAPERFAEQLDVLKAHGDLVPLARLRDGVREGRRQIALTFDDVCQDNLDNALPLLARHDAPATLFAVSGAIGSGQDYWWDALGRVFLEAPALPRRLALDLPGFPAIDLGEDSRLSAGRAAALAAWDATLDPPPCARANAYLRLSAALRDQPPERIEEVTRQVLQWAGLDRAGPREARPVDEQGLRTLAATGPVTIGGHSVSHRALDIAPPQEAEAEISACRARLVEILDRDVREFAYPYGRHLPTVTPGQVRSAGFGLACTTLERLILSSPDPFRLPRMAVPDLDGESFARLLHEVTGP